MHPSILVDDDINYKKTQFYLKENYDWGLSKIMTHFILGEIEIMKVKKIIYI